MSTIHWIEISLCVFSLFFRLPKRPTCALLACLWTIVCVTCANPTWTLLLEYLVWWPDAQACFPRWRQWRMIVASAVPCWDHIASQVGCFCCCAYFIIASFECDCKTPGCCQRSWIKCSSEFPEFKRVLAFVSLCVIFYVNFNPFLMQAWRFAPILVCPVGPVVRSRSTSRARSTATTSASPCRRLLAVCRLAVYRATRRCAKLSFCVFLCLFVDQFLVNW